MKRFCSIAVVALLGCDSAGVVPQNASESAAQPSVNAPATTETPAESTPIVHLTEAAAAKVREKLTLAEGECLFVGLAESDSDYPQYDLRRASAEEAKDLLHYESQGIPLATPRENAAFLQGMTVDWLELESFGGFVFQNPNEAEEPKSD